MLNSLNKNLTAILAAMLFFSACSETKRTLEVHYLKEGKLCSEVIDIDFIGKDGSINSPYIDTVLFSYLDSINYPDMNPDRRETFTSPRSLDFTKTIKPYSPEYYCAYTMYNIIKDIEYYNRLFDNKIDFNSQSEYKTIEVTLGDAPYLTTPDVYIFERNSNPSPSLFFHEIGHRAFWHIEDTDGLGIKFGGLSLIHMGLLEYFTMSLNNSPVIGEDCLPEKIVRTAAGLQYKYPYSDSLKLRYTYKLLEESYPDGIKNPHSNISKYLAASYATYSDDVLDKYNDNHRGAMTLASALWRIRETAGQEKTDKLVAQTILDLNRCMDMRPDFYTADMESLPNKIDWCDVFYGMIQKDKELFEGKDIQTIVNEFEKTGYPVDIIKY
jgi:hypothetical protein